MLKRLFIFALLLLPVSVFAEKLDVIADMPSGTYHSPVYITLTPTESTAKTFYSFKPDGYPNDAFLYTGAILLKHSSPFIYFSFTSTNNESKIKQNNYIIEYPSAIQFFGESISGSGTMNIVLFNSGSESVNIGYWYVQSESDMVVIPEGAMIAPDAKYTIRLKYSGNSSIVLRSPDDDERDILIAETPSVKVGGIVPKKTPIITKRVPRKILSTADIPQINIPPTASTIADIPSEYTQVNVIEEKPIPRESSGISPLTPEISPTTTTPLLSINEIAKASANESGQKKMNPVYLVFLVILSTGIGGFQWVMKRKQK